MYVVCCVWCCMFVVYTACKWYDIQVLQHVGAQSVLCDLCCVLCDMTWHDMQVHIRCCTMLSYMYATCMSYSGKRVWCHTCAPSACQVQSACTASAPSAWRHTEHVGQDSCHNAHKVHVHNLQVYILRETFIQSSKVLQLRSDVTQMCKMYNFWLSKCIHKVWQHVVTPSVHDKHVTYRTYPRETQHISKHKWQKTRNIWMSHFMSCCMLHKCVMALTWVLCEVGDILHVSYSMMAHKVHTHVARCVYMYVI